VIKDVNRVVVLGVNAIVIAVCRGNAIIVVGMVGGGEVEGIGVHVGGGGVRR